jgi:hypothetical protein
MRTMAKVIVIIGLALGVLGGIAAVVTLAFGDSLMETFNRNRAQMTPTLLQAQEGLKKATDRSPAHIAAVVGQLALIIVGGTLGLLALSSDTSRTAKTVFACITIAAGLGLLGFQSWIPAAAYVLGGFISLVAADSRKRISPPA